MDTSILKPFSAEFLVRIILRHMKPTRGPVAGIVAGPPATEARAATPWPEIEGIDSTCAGERLAHDVDLFGSTLGRFLRDFSNLRIPSVTAEPAALVAHGRLMHKLRGSAGILGAKAIHDLATDIEAACAAGAAAHAAQLTTTLAAQLQRLLHSATPTLNAARARAQESALPVDGELEPQLLVDLVDLLRQQNLAAVERFAAIAPLLQRRLGQESFALVREHMNNLQFNDAVRVLEQGVPASGNCVN